MSEEEGEKHIVNNAIVFMSWLSHPSREGQPRTKASAVTIEFQTGIDSKDLDNLIMDPDFLNSIGLTEMFPRRKFTLGRITFAKRPSRTWTSPVYDIWWSAETVPSDDSFFDSNEDDDR